jgi:hypothetical protein
MEVPTILNNPIISLNVLLIILNMTIIGKNLNVTMWSVHLHRMDGLNSDAARVHCCTAGAGKGDAALERHN